MGNLENTRNGFAHTLERLQENVNDDVPELIIAGQLVSLWSRAWALFPNEMASEFGKLQAASARRRNGLCQNCDNSVAARTTYDPICEMCDAKLQAEVDEIERELED